MCALLSLLVMTKANSSCKYFRTQIARYLLRHLHLSPPYPFADFIRLLLFTPDDQFPFHLHLHLYGAPYHRKKDKAPYHLNKVLRTLKRNKLFGLKTLLRYLINLLVQYTMISFFQQNRRTQLKIIKDKQAGKQILWPKNATQISFEHKNMR